MLLKLEFPPKITGIDYVYTIRKTLLLKPFISVDDWVMLPCYFLHRDCNNFYTIYSYMNLPRIDNSWNWNLIVFILSCFTYLIYTVFQNFIYIGNKYLNLIGFYGLILFYYIISHLFIHSFDDCLDSFHIMTTINNYS